MKQFVSIRILCGNVFFNGRTNCNRSIDILIVIAKALGIPNEDAMGHGKADQR